MLQYYLSIYLSMRQTNKQTISQWKEIKGQWYPLSPFSNLLQSRPPSCSKRLIRFTSVSHPACHVDWRSQAIQRRHQGTSAPRDPYLVNADYGCRLRLITNNRLWSVHNKLYHKQVKSSSGSQKIYIYIGVSVQAIGGSRQSCRSQVAPPGDPGN